MHRTEKEGGYGEGGLGESKTKLDSSVFEHLALLGMITEEEFKPDRFRGLTVKTGSNNGQPDEIIFSD